MVTASLAAQLLGMLARRWALLAPPEYRAAARPALLLAFAAVAYGAYYVACLGIQLSLRTSLLGWTAGAAALAALAANAVLAPRFGGMGAALATLLGNVILAIGTYVVAQNVHPLPFQGGRLLVLFLLAVGLGLAAQSHWLLRWSGVAKLGAIGTFLAAAWVAGMLPRQLRARV